MPSQMASRRLPGILRGAPREAQDGPKSRQERPQTNPRAAKTAPGAGQRRSQPPGRHFVPLGGRCGDFRRSIYLRRIRRCTLRLPARTRKCKNSLPCLCFSVGRVVRESLSIYLMRPRDKAAKHTATTHPEYLTAMHDMY